MVGFQNHRCNQNWFVYVTIIRSIPFQGIVNIQGNTEKPVNLSDLYCMVLESECIANDFDDEEDDGEFWQKDNGGERGAFYGFQNFMDDE